MQHPLFGDITYEADDQAWCGSCALATLAGYGRDAESLMLETPDPLFARGCFPLRVRDESGRGPIELQARAFQHVVDHEEEVCLAVVGQLLELHRTERAKLAGLERCRRIPLVGGFIAGLAGPEYHSVEELKPFVRCTEVEIADFGPGEHALVAFYFATAWGWEVEHGLSAVYHPETGASWGDASYLDYYT